MKSYEWDVSLLKEMKRYLLHSNAFSKTNKSMDMKQLNHLIGLCYGTNNRFFDSKDVGQIFLENISYMFFHMDIDQFFYLNMLDRQFCKDKGNFVDLDKERFDFRSLLDLFEEFLDWFPSNSFGNLLKLYYKNKFPTHMFYNQKRDPLNVLGKTYSFYCFNTPFVYLTQTSFIETFITLIHEMGHVLIYLLDIPKRNGVVESLFSEVSGKYFELLAFQFLLEKKLYKRERRKSAVFGFESLKIWVQSLRFLNLWQLSSDGKFVEEHLCEIYSYLGSLELWGRYHGDYEKQLYDLIGLECLHASHMDEYLEKARFSWRENYFEQLKKYTKKLKR